MDGLVGKNRLKDIWKRIFSAMKIITGDVDFENDGTLQKQIFDLKEKLETPEVIDGDTVTPINDVAVWIKCAGIDDTYKYTTLSQVLADNTCMYSLTSDENAMKYLTRSTGFADELCANENFMTYLGQSAYVDTSILNSDFWVTAICNSNYIDYIFISVVPTLSSNNGCITTSSDYNANNRYIPFNGEDIGNTGKIWLAQQNVGAAWYKYTFPSIVSIIKIKTCFVDNAAKENLALNPFTFKLTVVDENDNTVTLYEKLLQTPEFSDKWVDIILPTIKKVKSITWYMDNYSYSYGYKGTAITRIKIYGLC